MEGPSIVGITELSPTTALAEEIRSYVKVDDLSRATRRLMDYARDFSDDRDVKNTAIVLAREFHSLRQRIRRLGRSDEDDVRSNQLAQRILALVDEIEATSEDSLEKPEIRRRLTESGGRGGFSPYRTEPEVEKVLPDDGAFPTGASLGVYETDPLPDDDKAVPPEPSPDSFAAGPPPADRDPPRRAYALLDCPEAVAAGQAFELLVGLSEVQAPGVKGAPLERPATSTGAYEVAVHVVAEGFRLGKGEVWRRVLPVTGETPYPTAVLHLVAEPTSEKFKPRIISATYSIDGQTIGYAYRAIVVVRSVDLLAAAEVEEQERGVDLTAPTSEPRPDLTLNIRRSESKYWITLENAAGFEVPVEPQVLDVEDTRAFARQLVDSVNLKENKKGSYRHLVGKARTIADKLPDAFWDLLGKVAAKAREEKRAPTVLILSAESFIPWELAAVEPPIDPSAPPFLAAQADVGRWILARRLPATPPVRHRVGRMAVVSGLYNDPKWSRLEEAEAEAEELQARFGVRHVDRVDATLDAILEAIEGNPEADLLHMAIHGKYDPGGLENGLVLTDDTILDPDTLKGSDMKRPLFVFLNACQVGSGDRVLSDYAGIAASFLHLGASGVIAPLWSIDDGRAKEIALAFYDELFRPDEPPSPAELLRLERKKFRKGDPPVSSTFLAYQYFGHPALKVSLRLPTEEETP